MLLSVPAMEVRLDAEGPAYDLRTLLRHREAVAGQTADVSLQAHPSSSLPALALKPSKKAPPWSKDGKRDRKGRGSPQSTDVLPSWSARPWNAKLSASAQASPSASPTMPNLGAFEDDGEEVGSQGAGEEEPEDEVAFQVVQATFAEEDENNDEDFINDFGHDGGTLDLEVDYLDADLDENPDESVRQTVEYYLSDENLSKDPFFHRAITDVPDGWVELGFLLACGRLKKLGATEAQILRVLKDSDNLDIRAEGEDEDGIEVPAAVRRRRDLPPLQISASASRRGRRAQHDHQVQDDCFADSGNWCGEGPWPTEYPANPNHLSEATGLTVVRSLLPGYWKDSLGNDVFVPHGEMVAFLYWKWGGVKKLPIFVDPDKNTRIWCGNGILEHAGYPLGAAPGSSPTQLHWRTWDGRLSIWYKEGQDPWAGDDEFGAKGGVGRGGGSNRWVQNWAGDKGGGKGHRWRGSGWNGGTKGGGHGSVPGISHGAGAVLASASIPATADAYPGAKGAGKKVTGGKGDKGGEKGSSGKNGAHALTLADFITVKEAKGKKKKKTAEAADGPCQTVDTL